MPAGVGDLLPGEDAADDLDRLTHAAQWMTERDAVQPLHHLGPRYSETQQEPAAGQVGQRHRGLRDRDRGAGADLDHARAEQHPLGAGGQVAERRGRVRAPGLGDPADVQAEPLRLDGELDGVLTRRRFDGGGGAHLAFGPLLYDSARLCFMPVSCSRSRTKTIFCLLVRHRVDGDVQAGAARAHLRPLLEQRARPVGLQGEPPGSGRVAGVADGPGEAVRRVALGDRADRLPLPHGPGGRCGR